MRSKWYVDCIVLRLHGDACLSFLVREDEASEVSPIVHASGCSS